MPIPEDKFPVDPYIKICSWCANDEKPIDIRKAQTDEEHEYVKMITSDLYFHKECFINYRRSLSEYDN